MTPPFLVDEILPSREVHLVAGPTGAGKTRWLLESLLEWSAGRSFLRFPSHPVPWLYVSSDRTLESFHRTLDSLGITYSRVPTLAAWDMRLSLMEILDASQGRPLVRHPEFKLPKAASPRAELVVIEMFGSYADGEAISSRQIAAFLRAMSHITQRDDLTIIGIMEEPKMKPHERYRNPRQRISGPAAWGHHSETIFLVEYANDRDPTDPARVLYVCPRNAPGLILEASIEDGHFRLVDPAC